MCVVDRKTLYLALKLIRPPRVADVVAQRRDQEAQDLLASHVLGEGGAEHADGQVCEVQDRKAVVPDT